METSSILTWVGTLVTLGGTGVSVWQAWKSRSAAEEAKRIRSQLIDHREAAELAQVQAVCKRALKSMEKYGPASTPSSRVGISPGSDAGDVQDFIVILREHRAHFGARQPNEADAFCETLTPLLEAFAQANDNSAVLHKNGALLMTHLSSFAAVIKRQLDHKRDVVR